MKKRKQRCPYCGRKMSYFSAFFSRRKAEYRCTRCGKESKVVISKIIIPIFIIAAVISLAVMGIWFMMNLLSNPLGILLVAAPLFVFLLISPKFVALEPLKKYQKSMEAKKAGIEYSGNLTAYEFDDEAGFSSENSGQFKINSDLFNQIKSERSSSKTQTGGSELSSDSGSIENAVGNDNESYVHIIKDVSEDHGSTAAYPLKKIHSEGTKVIKKEHYINDDNSNGNDEVPAQDDEYVKEYRKNETNKYSSNRRF